MLVLIYLVPILICTVVGFGALTGLGFLFSHFKKTGKDKGSKATVVGTGKRGRSKGQTKNLQKGVEKGKTKAEREEEKPLTPKKAEKLEKSAKKKQKTEINVSNKKGKGVLTLKNPNAKAIFSSGDAVMRAEFRDSIEKYNNSYNGEQDNQASLRVTYNDGSFKDDFFAGPESVIKDNMFPFVFENTKNESRYPEGVVMNIGGRTYSFEFKSKEEAVSFYKEKFEQGRTMENAEETKTETRNI